MDLGQVQQKIVPHLEDVEKYLEQLKTTREQLARLEGQMKQWVETLHNDILLLDTVSPVNEEIRNERKIWIVFIQDRLARLTD